MQKRWLLNVIISVDKLLDITEIMISDRLNYLLNVMYGYFMKISIACPSPYYIKIHIAGCSDIILTNVF